MVGIKVTHLGGHIFSLNAIQGREIAPDGVQAFVFA